MIGRHCVCVCGIRIATAELQGEWQFYGVEKFAPG